MKEKETKEDSVELRGHVFNKKKLGLDEDEVISFVTQLMDERDKLAERQGHLTYLAELAEKTVAEADKMANRIKEEAKNQAQTEAEEIKVEAEKQAQQMIEDRTTEAIAVAEKEIEAMKVEVETKSVELTKKNAEKLQSDLRQTAGEMCQKILEQTDSFRNEVSSFEADLDEKLADIINNYDKSSVKTKKDDGKSADSDEGKENAAKARVEETPDTDKKEEKKEEKSVSKKDWYDTGDEELVVLEFLPPRDQDEIEKIKTHLESLPEVSTTEMTIMVDKTSIEVITNKEIDLFETLEALPKIQQVTEVEEGEQRTLQIILDLVSSIDLSRDTLNKDFSNILSKRR